MALDILCALRGVAVALMCFTGNDCRSQVTLALLSPSERDSLDRFRSNPLPHSDYGSVTFEIDSDASLEFSYIRDTLRGESLFRNKKLLRHIWYYPNGRIGGLTTFVDECKNGPFYSFYSSGILKEFGSMRCVAPGETARTVDSTYVESTGDWIKTVSLGTGRSVKDGQWVYFDSLGLLVRKEEWVDGTIRK